MSADLSIGNILLQVKSKLLENGIKLWLAPYYVEGVGACDAELERLANDFEQILSVPATYCLAAVTELQSNAIDKIRTREEFSKSGLATIKVRTPCHVGGTRLITIHIRLSDTGDQFQDAVAKELQIERNRIKLIGSGKVLAPLQSLEEQGIQNNQQVMAVILDEVPDGTASDNIYDRVQKARQDALLLIDQDAEYMQMEDQDGNAIHLPPNERRSLMMALALHEKGKAALKKDQYSDALVLFLEADSEYSTCNSQLLSTVDNYALLNLDVAWCYLCLRSVMQLPDAEKRLFKCEQNFKRSYGENFDRVVALKGDASNEKALIMRLHLLQAVLQYHQNRRAESEAMLSLAERELNALQVNDESLAALVEMGYSANEARVGLRSCGGVLDQAITHIIDRRATREAGRKRANAENKLKVTKSKDKTWVNPRSLHVLMGMGFDKDLCEVALKKTDNDLNRSINMLQDQPEQLRQAAADDFIVDDESQRSMLTMGFNEEIIKMALQFSSNDMSKAVEMLLKMQTEGTYDNLLTQILDGAGAAGGASTSAAASSAARSHIDTKLKAMEAFSRFSEDISAEDDDHLDLPLLQEREILSEYKRYLQM